MRTYNRQPKFVDTPSASSIKIYTLNISSWKGINDDQNYIQVDQETFADATNVIVDEDNILRSRPSIKRLNVSDWEKLLYGAPLYCKYFDITSGTVPSYSEEEWRPQDIIFELTYVDVFGEVLVFYDSNPHYLYFLDKPRGSLSCIQLNGIGQSKITIIDESNKLFVFTNSTNENEQVFYYDLNDTNIHTSDTRIVKVVYTPNQHEEKNILYSGNIYTYKLWSGVAEKEIKELQGFDFLYHLKSGEADYEVVVSKGETDLLHLPSIFYSIEENVSWKPVFYNEKKWAKVNSNYTITLVIDGEELLIQNPYYNTMFEHSSGICFTKNGDAIVLYSLTTLSSGSSLNLYVLSLSDLYNGFVLADTITTSWDTISVYSYVTYGEWLCNGDFVDFSNNKLTGTWYYCDSVHRLESGEIVYENTSFGGTRFFSPCPRYSGSKINHNYDLPLDSNNKFSTSIENYRNDNFLDIDVAKVGGYYAAPYTYYYNDFYVEHFSDCSVLIGTILDMSTILYSDIRGNYTYKNVNVNSVVENSNSTSKVRIWFSPILIYPNKVDILKQKYSSCEFGGLCSGYASTTGNPLRFGSIVKSKKGSSQSENYVDAYSLNGILDGMSGEVPSSIPVPALLSINSKYNNFYKRKLLNSLYFVHPSQLKFNVSVSKYSNYSEFSDSDKVLNKNHNPKILLYFSVSYMYNTFTDDSTSTGSLDAYNLITIRTEAYKYFTYCVKSTGIGLGICLSNLISSDETDIGFTLEETSVRKTLMVYDSATLIKGYEDSNGIEQMLRLSDSREILINFKLSNPIIVSNDFIVTSSYIVNPRGEVETTTSHGSTYSNIKLKFFPGYRTVSNQFEILPLYIDKSNVYFIASSNTMTKGSLNTINDTIYKFGFPDNAEDAIDIKIKGDGHFVNQDLSISTYLDGYWFAIGNKVYRNKYTVDENGNWQLYIPENNYEEFETDVTGLMTISTDTVAAFTDNAVYTSTIVGQDENGNNIYGKFIKSKFNLGNKSFSDILTTYDGKYTLFNTMRGLAGMSFQDFINSTDQALTFLSEPIYSQYFEFVQKPVLMTLYKYWLYCYHSDDTIIWILDFRTSSWWKYEVNKPIQKIIIYNDEIYFLQSGRLCHFDYDIDYYYDEYQDVENSASPDFIERSQINWSLTSQKLYLGSIDRYKTVKDITIYNVQDDERDINFVLDCKNYRHHIDDGKEEWIEYNVSKIRTFVKRLHYSKVREFQYTLRNDPNAQVQSPMKISNIAIKYHVGDEVR